MSTRIKYIRLKAEEYTSILSIFMIQYFMIRNDMQNTLSNPAIFESYGDYHLVWYFPLYMYHIMLIVGIFFFTRALTWVKSCIYTKVISGLFLFSTILTLVHISIKEYFEFDVYITIWRYTVYTCVLFIATFYIYHELYMLIKKRFNE